MHTKKLLIGTDTTVNRFSLNAAVICENDFDDLISNIQHHDFNKT